MDRRDHRGGRRDLAPGFNVGLENAHPSSFGDDGGPRNNEGVVEKEADGTKDSVRSTPAPQGDPREGGQGGEILGSEVDELHECEEFISLGREKRKEATVPDLYGTPGDVGSGASGQGGSAGVDVGMDNSRIPCTIFVLSGWSLEGMQVLIQARTMRGNLLPHLAVPDLYGVCIPSLLGDMDRGGLDHRRRLNVAAVLRTANIFPVESSAPVEAARKPPGI